MLIADGGGGSRPTVVPTVNPSTTQRPPSTNNGGSTQSDAAERARELQRQIEALLERIREMQRQAAEARKRALEAQQKAEAARKAAEAAREKAEKTKAMADELAAKKAEQDYKLADARMKKANADVQQKDKEIALAKAQVAQKKEQKKSADGTASAETDKKVKTAQDELDAAKRTSTLSNDYLDYQEKETKAVAAEAKVQELTPVAGRPQSTVTQAEWDKLTAAQNEAKTLRADADAAKTKFMNDVGAEAPIEFYGPQTGQPATQVPGGQNLANDPLHSPLLQFLQVTPPLGSSPGSTLVYPTLGPQLTPDVTKTLGGIADGKTVEQIAKDRGMTTDEVVAEAKAAGVTIEAGKPEGDTQATTVKRGDATLVYTRNTQDNSLTVKGSFADPKAPGGTKTIEATRDKDGRFIQTVKDDKTGDTTTHIIDPNKGTRTDIVVHKDGSKVETTTDLTGATVTRPVKAGEDYLDVAKAAGLTPEQLLALNPDIDYGKPLKEGQQMVVSGVRTTTVTTNKDGTKLEKTVESDGSMHVVATTADGRRITLMGDPEVDNSPGEKIRKGLFEENKTVAQMAKEMGLSEDQVLAALPAGTVHVTQPTSDNGDVETRTIFDPKTNKVIVETHDWQHDSSSRQVIDEKTVFKVRQYDADSGQWVMANVAGGVGYMQKLADDQGARVGDLDQQIKDLDNTIRQYTRMGEPTSELLEQRRQLVAQRDTAKGEADIAQARATSAQLKQQQVQLDKIAANAYQRQFVARPGSQEQKDATQTLNDILALTDKVDRLVKSADVDVTFLIANLDRQQKHTAKTEADTKLQDAFQEWKDEVWMWQNVDDKTRQRLEADGLRPNHRVFGSSDQENEAAWEAFKSQQEQWDEYGYDGSTPQEQAARNAWLQRNQAGAAELDANDRYYTVSIDKGKADAHVIQGDLDRLQVKKDAWVAANPKDFSENFPGVKGEHGGQAELDQLNDQLTQLKVGQLEDAKGQKYNNYLKGLSIDEREDPKKLEEANQAYGDKYAKDLEGLDQQINDLQMAGLRNRAKVSEDYIAQWARDNPALQSQLTTLETTKAGNVRMADHLIEQREALLNGSHEGRQLKSALAMKYDTQYRLTQIGDADVARVQKDLDGIDKTVEGQTWLRDVFSDKAEDSQHWTQEQRDKAQQLRDDLAAGRITLTQYTKDQDALMDSYGFKSIDIGQDLQDSNETWAVVDDAVRMTVTAAAGIATTIATGGNIAAGIAVGVAVNQLWDTSNDAYAAANGHDIYADGHSSLFTLGVRGARTAFGHDNLTYEQTMFTLKDDAVDVASAAVTGTGAGVGLKTAASLTAKTVAKKGLADGTLKMGSRAWVGSRAGMAAQGVDGAGRVAVETLHVGLDGKLGTEEGQQRIGVTVTNSLAGLITAPFTGAASAAIPLNPNKVFSPQLVAQFGNDAVGSLATGELSAQMNYGRHMNGGELFTASLQALPGTALNVAMHPALHTKADPQATNTTTGAKPVVADPLLDGNRIVPRTVGRRSWEDVAANVQPLIDRHQAAGQPGATVKPFSPSAGETTVFNFLRSDPAAGSGTVFVVSRLGPTDTVFGHSGGVRARNSDTYDNFADASAAAARQGGAWVNRVQPHTDRVPLHLRVRVRSDEIVGSIHVNKNGDALPYAIPNTKIGDLRKLKTGEPTVTDGLKGRLSSTPSNARINPLQMMSIGAGMRLTSEVVRASTGMVIDGGWLSGRVASIAPGPLSSFGRWAYLSSSQRGKEALAAATVGKTDKADKLINKVINGMGFRGDKVMSDADANQLKLNIKAVGTAGKDVQQALKDMGADAPSDKHFRLHTLDDPANAVTTLYGDYLTVPGMRKFLLGLRTEGGGEFEGKTRTETRDTLLKRLDAMSADELQHARDTSGRPEARLLQKFPGVYDRFSRTADGRANLRTAHDKLFKTLMGMVEDNGKLSMTKAEGLGGSTNAPSTQLGKFSRRAVILTNLNLAIGAGFKARAAGDGFVTNFANAADGFTLGTAGMNIIYNVKVEKLDAAKTQVKAEAQAAKLSEAEYRKQNPAADKLVTDAETAKNNWNKYRDFAGITSGLRAYGQGALMMQLDFSALPNGSLIQGTLVGASFAQGTLTMGWVGLQQIKPLRNGTLPNLTKIAKWTTAGAIVLVPLVSQAITKIFQPAGEKRESYAEELWKKLFPDHTPVEKNGGLPWTIPDTHAGDPQHVSDKRVAAEELPRLVPVYVTVDGSRAGTRTLWGIAGEHTDTLFADPASFQTRIETGADQQGNPALAQLLNFNPQYKPELNDGQVTNANGDPDTLLNGWQVKVGDRWSTAA
ncbi:hypothetical protein [Piscinibacter gummiphilus]|uniref:LysM domain-containing protein n=1 Tax=Piscinibacter gummiphilus TaxID=946333 RepID=A0ABZ0CW73_9BURK|nr:hypothetical protein [Piscinibacter gummiphilus]WOB09228.1 hypothetical protein RXV79_04015 [Piscinibacter gummiphilus]